MQIFRLFLASDGSTRRNLASWQESTRNRRHGALPEKSLPSSGGQSARHTVEDDNGGYCPAKPRQATRSRPDEETVGRDDRHGQCIVGYLIAPEVRLRTPSRQMLAVCT